MEKQFSSIEINTADYFHIVICDKNKTEAICIMNKDNTKDYQREMAKKIVNGLNKQ